MRIIYRNQKDGHLISLCFDNCSIFIVKVEDRNNLNPEYDCNLCIMDSNLSSYDVIYSGSNDNCNKIFEMIHKYYENNEKCIDISNVISEQKMQLLKDKLKKFYYWTKAVIIINNKIKICTSLTAWKVVVMGYETKGFSKIFLW